MGAIAFADKRKLIFNGRSFIPKLTLNSTEIRARFSWPSSPRPLRLRPHQASKVHYAPEQASRYQPQFWAHPGSHSFMSKSKDFAGVARGKPCKSISSACLPQRHCLYKSSQRGPSSRQPNNDVLMNVVHH